MESPLIEIQRLAMEVERDYKAVNVHLSIFALAKLVARLAEYIKESEREY